MEKKRVVVNYSKISEELKNEIIKKYPLGFTNHMFKVKTNGNDFFYAITLDTSEISYLIKVPVKIDVDRRSDDDDFDDNDDNLTTENETFDDKGAAYDAEDDDDDEFADRNLKDDDDIDDDDDIV